MTVNRFYPQAAGAELKAWVDLLSSGVAGLLAVVVSWFFSGAVLAQSYADHPKARDFIKTLTTEHNFDSNSLNVLFGQAQKKQSILDAIARPAEKTKLWKEYRGIFLTRSRIDKGVQFWQENRAVLDLAHSTYGVPPEIVVAIIGVETRYGHNTGRYRVIDALSTLAFDYPKRSPFFTKELKHFLLLTREQRQNPLDLKGSYAGAMGYGQFMPSSYRSYAVDFDNDDLVDIWTNTTDAIGSVANYFKRHGWRGGEAVVSRARISGDYDRQPVNESLKPAHTVGQLRQLGFTPIVDHEPEQKATIMKLQGEHGAEFWIGLNNFYVITRYNHSRLYAMAVYQLGEAIRREARIKKVAGIIE